MHQHHTLQIFVQGMTCASCETLIAETWEKIPGITRATVDSKTGKATIEYTQKPDMRTLQDSIALYGYSIGTEPISSDRWKSAGGILILILAFWLLSSRLPFLKTGFAVTENLSLGFAFILGLVASVSSCGALTGGILLSLGARNAAKYPQMSAVQKFKPHLFFNAGRILSYAFFGGIIGYVGQMVSFSQTTNAILTILASLLMIVVGLSLLGWRLPRLAWGNSQWSKKFMAYADEKKHTSAFLLGGATFFLPCGFTQALQLYVLSKADPFSGTLTMFVFALGTMPALLSIGTLSSLGNSKFRKKFSTAAGALVLVLGVSSFQNGYNLMKTVFPSSTISKQANVILPAIENGNQIIDMAVNGYEYTPSIFTVRAGTPVEWRIDGSGAFGCAQVITAPKLNVTQMLSKNGITTIRFTPTKPGEIPFSCSMGMTTPGAKFVVVADNVPASNSAVQTRPCDPKRANCL
ncbi:MAG: sulfite exporter TauE/SafE family protein [Parcubacteria group bacterium]|nr:sulfite exporter TauE/SafE family protein [Parcubacteria group bacterium]